MRRRTRAGLLGVWETAEASHAAGIALQPKVRELLGDITRVPDDSGVRRAGVSDERRGGMTGGTLCNTHASMRDPMGYRTSRRSRWSCTRCATTAPGLPVLDLSVPTPAAALTFLRAPAESVGDWHHAPRRQFVTVLTSLVEVTTGDGQTRRFGPGDVVLAEDTTGTGHITTVVGASECVLLIVVLPEAQGAA